MDAIARRALALWGMDGASCTAFAHRENTIFKVADGRQVYALRAHRGGYRSDAELASELAWMAAASEGGISVPSPIRTTAGQHLGVVEGIQFDLLHWLAGNMLVDEMDGSPARRADLMATLGRTMADFHLVSDGWKIPKDFDRPHWDRDGLLGDAPVWGRFWENPALNADQSGELQDFCKVADRDLRALDLDYGLIHADLLGENVLVDGNRMHLIDFDDGGFGFRLFELSTALIRHLDAPDYRDLKSALFAGYRAARPLDGSAFDLMLALRATTYVGWIADRTDLADFAERQARNIALARRLTGDYLSSR